MYIEKENLSKTNKRLICKLNELCFGMHGHLSVLLKSLHYFFYFKKEKKEEFASLFLQGVFIQLKHIIVLSRLMEQLGGYTEIFDYKRNQVDYYKLNEKGKVFESEAILDIISNQKLLVKEYLKIKDLNCVKKVKEVIEQVIEEINNDLELLLSKLTKQGGILLIN